MAGADVINRSTQRTLSLLSVVAPMLDEEGNAEAFYERVCAALGDLPFELVIVDDGSKDATPAILDRLASEDPRVKVITLARSFGHQTALTAGLDHARGDAVAMLDADLQDPPELIPALLEHWRRGSDVVYAVREHRAGESAFKLASAKWFYRVMNALSRIELQRDAGDFRLLDRRALDALLAMRERSRYLRGMTVWVGFTQTAVPYAREARPSGRTKYTLPRMVHFSIDAILSFSNAPLQAATLLGFCFAGLAFLGIPAVIVARIADVYVPGVSSILMVVLLLGGIQLIAVGVIGEYIGRIYDEVKRRPLYVVRSRRNTIEDELVDPAEREGISTW